MRRWIVGGQAVPTFRALIKSGHFERAWEALVSTVMAPVNENRIVHDVALAARAQ